VFKADDIKKNLAKSYPSLVPGGNIVIPPNEKVNGYW